jgi:hypothetical protein
VSPEAGSTQARVPCAGSVVSPKLTGDSRPIVSAARQAGLQQTHHSPAGSLSQPRRLLLSGDIRETLPAGMWFTGGM